MSRSRRKTPIFNFGYTGAGKMRRWKRFAAKTLRQATRYWLRKDPEEIPDPKAKEVADHWGSPADGKRYLEPEDEWMRK